MGGLVSMLAGQVREETPRFELESASARYSVRRYEPHVVARVYNTSLRPGERLDRVGFTVLADYIGVFRDGRNRRRLLSAEEAAAASSSMSQAFSAASAVAASAAASAAASSSSAAATAAAAAAAAAPGEAHGVKRPLSSRSSADSHPAVVHAGPSASVDGVVAHGAHVADSPRVSFDAAAPSPSSPSLSAPASEATSAASQALGPSVRIAMTAPVESSRLLVQRSSAGDGAVPRYEVVETMSFMLPQALYRRVDDAPVPLDTRVHIEQVPARRCAVMRFPGYYDMANCDRKVAELVAMLEADGHRLKRTTGGDPVWTLARYNPPFVLPPLRTNEIIIELA